MLLRGASKPMAEAILGLYRQPERLIAMGEAGRRYVEEHFSLSMRAAQLEVMSKALYLKNARQGKISDSGETIVSG
jgi:hypothetical protein